MMLEWGQLAEVFSMREGKLEIPPENEELRSDEMLQREMSEFAQYASEQPSETLSLSEGGFDEQGRFIPGKVEQIDSEAAEFDPELKELTDELNTWFQQGEQMSCAVAVQTMAVNQLSEEAYTERELLDVGIEKRWYNNGTCPRDVGKIAEELGMDAEQYHGVAASELVLANDPEVKVLANVDSTLLQYPGAFKRCQPDHCVQVLRVEDTPKGKVVLLNDPGHENGRGAVYPLEVFERAYKGDITTIRKVEMA